ncbi:MAG: HAMP domain-containing histidine kinase [Phycisphaerae bacterium]|nr:HAMP domain-containing histidine kinase [Phycisphaerae bacterium]
MNLRHKFGVLSLIYVLALSVNLLMSGWCILVYFQSAFRDVQSTIILQDEIARLRTLVRRQAVLLQERPINDDARTAYGRLQSKFDAMMASVTAAMGSGMDLQLWSKVQNAAKRHQAAARPLISPPPAEQRSTPTTKPMPEWDQQAYAELEDLLERANIAISGRRASNVERAANTQQRVVTILIANFACGACFCILGLFFLRRWVLRPVVDLRVATKQIAGGSFSYRIKPRSRDELGQLANEVNQMSATIEEMQTKLVEQERLAAAGEMVTRLAHNIRNPLAGIRSLAESTMQIGSIDAETSEHQRRIVETVDRFEKWLRELQQSVSPVKLNLQPVCVAELIDGVTRVLQPMADRVGVALETAVDPAMPDVRVDSYHMEQALVALITNAIQASSTGHVVSVSATPVGEGGSRWRLRVEDQGVGIPRKLRDKIFLPYFTTKRDGHGIGLATANKVVKIHGGQLTVESAGEQGSVFTATMPGLILEDA